MIDLCSLIISLCSLMICIGDCPGYTPDHCWVWWWCVVPIRFQRGKGTSPLPTREAGRPLFRANHWRITAQYSPHKDYEQANEHLSPGVRGAIHTSASGIQNTQYKFIYNLKSKEQSYPSQSCPWSCPPLSETLASVRQILWHCLCPRWHPSPYAVH